MVGNSQQSSLGVEELLAGAAGATQTVPGPSRQQPGSGIAVLRRDVIVRPEDVEIVLPSSLVADLYDPSLVISQGYVGPDRRRFDRASPTVPSGPPAWLRQVRSVALLTAMVVLPLTAISARSVPPASVGSAPSQSAQPAPTAKAQARADRQAQRAITANAAQMARAEAAYQRGLARAQGSHFGASGPAAALAAGAGAAGRSGSTSQPAGGMPPAVDAVQQAQVGLNRSAAQEATAQARLDAQAAAAQHRADQAAARAQARAERQAARLVGSSSSDSSGTTATAPTAP